MRRYTRIGFEHLLIAIGVIFGSIVAGTLVFAWTDKTMDIVFATFWGPFLGGVVGLVAILAGAYYNAEVNRRRDDDTRLQETRTLAMALSGEIALITGTAQDSIDTLLPLVNERSMFAELSTRDAIVFPAMVERIGLLWPELSKKIVEFYGHAWAVDKAASMRITKGRQCRQVVNAYESVHSLGRDLKEALDRVTREGRF